MKLTQGDIWDRIIVTMLSQYSFIIILPMGLKEIDTNEQTCKNS